MDDEKGRAILYEFEREKMLAPHTFEKLFAPVFLFHTHAYLDHSFILAMLIE